ncbi:solute carrier family 22 member 7-like [Dermacentor andersoni]|uniref:solute carrier family 22 member 7-like n=1 Tax=Dermacentor andersoni TaxID=34620 RepID=UPI002155D9B2|nr:solute carrier family 22 member 7-like [Dermacentor andersoni]
MTSQKRGAAPPASYSFGENVWGPNPIHLLRGADRDEEVPLGDGRFQKQVLLASMLAGTTFLLHLVSFRLTTRILDHWCRHPEAFTNLSIQEWRNLATPIEKDGCRSHCARREPPDGGSKAYIVSCEAWNFDFAPYGNNIVSEWRLVCDRRWLIELAVLTYMVAGVIALPTAGVTADRIGRKAVINVSLAALLVAGFTTSLANSYLLFVALRIVVSVTSNSLWLVQYSVLYEVSTPANRDYYCFLSMAAASVAMPLCVLGISRIRLAWDATHLVLMVPTTMLAAVLSTVRDESPAWLLTTMDTREAERVALKATRMNNADTDFCRTWFASEALRAERRNSEQPSERNVLSTILKQLKRRFLLLCYMWSALSFAFNQVNLNDIFSVKKATAAAGILGMLAMYAVAYFFILRYGAKRSCMVAMLLFSLLAVALTAVYGGEQSLLSSVLVVLLRMLANLFVVLAFVVTVRHYPVKVRCTGICVGFALGRLTGSLGEVVFRLAPKHRRDIMIAVVAIVMALASMATEYLPSRVPSVVLAPASISTRSRGSSQVAGDELRHPLQALFARLPRRPVKARSSKGRRPRDERLPEQFLLRASNISQSSSNTQH